MPLTPTLTTWLALNSCDDVTATYMYNVRTGAPMPGGALNLGDYFDLTNSEAANLSNTATGTLYAGRYRRILVDSGATASNVKTGTIGLMGAGTQPQMNRVTSYDKGIVGAHACVFLNTVTPGNYGFVQELGIASILCGATLTKSGPATGDLMNSTTLGVLDDPTVQEFVPASMGIALSPPNPNTLILVQLDLPVLQG